MADSRSQQFITQTSLSSSWLCGLSMALLGPAGLEVTWLLITVWVQVHSTYWSFFWEPGPRGSHRLGCTVLRQRVEIQEDEPNHGISLKSFTWNRHSVTAAHISLVHASQIPKPKANGARYTTPQAPGFYWGFLFLCANEVNHREGGPR